MQYHNKKHKIFYVPRGTMKQPIQKGILLSKAIEGHTLSCRARQLSEHTISDYAHTFKIFLAHVGDVNIATIQAAQVTAFMAAQNKVSAKTVLNYHVGLSALWTWALKNDYVTTHIMRKVDAPKPDEIIIHPFTEVEVRALLQSVRVNADRDRAMILLLLDTGMRASEFCNLARTDIDLATKQARVFGKGRKERYLPFSNRTASALFKHLTNLPDDEPPFTINRNSLRQHIARLGKRAGVQNAHPHRFRHTFACRFLINQGDPYTLQALLGHTTMEMVRKYIELTQVDIDAAHKRASPVENWKL